MKTIARVMLGTVCIWLTGIVTAFGVNYTFEVNTTDWTLSGSGADRINTGAPYGTVTPSWVVSIPANGSASSPVVNPGTSEITDFWTKPQLVTGTITPTDDASVQFAFKTGYVMVRVGSDAGFTDVDVSAIADVTTWLHVTVIITSDDWTLKLNGSLVGTYALHDAGSPQTPWFSVANGSGSAATLLDDVHIFDNAQLSTALTESGSKIASVSVSGGNVAGTVSSALAKEIRAFTDYACTTPAGGRPVSFDVGSSAPNKTFTDSSFSGAAVYYKLVITADGTTTAMESTPSFAAYGSARGAASDYWVGVPVDYAPGDGKLLTAEGVNGVFGDQLAVGLTGNANENLADQVHVYVPGSLPSVYYLSGVGIGPWTWTWISGPSLIGSVFGASTGLFIHRATGHTAPGRTVLAGKVYSGSGTASLSASGWSMVSHPYSSGLQKTAVSDVGGNDNDLMIINNNGDYRTLRKHSTLGWRLSTGGAIPSDWAFLKLGQAAFYQPASSAATLTFTP